MQMSSTLVRGMAFGTMLYEGVQAKKENSTTLYPTIASSVVFGKPPVADGSKQLACDPDGGPIRVDHEVELYFGDSDMTWLVFFWNQC